MVFVNGTVYWQCRSVTWHEHLRKFPQGPYADKPRESWPAYAFTLHSWPDLKQYFSLVRGYNYRSLSFEEDALRAFTAIIDVFCNTFPSGFLFGVPEFFFDIGLLWTRSGPLKRRKGFPGWSWVGWSGRIEFAMGDAWRPERPGSFKLNVRPMVEWKKVQNESLVQLRIDNSYHLYPQMAYNSDTVLPKGWIRSAEHEHLNDSSNIFSHPSIQGQAFCYPFPITAGVAALNLDLYSPILPFRAEKCTMLLGSVVEIPIDCYLGHGSCLTVELKDNAGLQTGVIESLFVSQYRYEEGDPCELIAISKGSLGAPQTKDGIELFAEVEAFPQLKDKETYEFYNVLWIEWKDGIAYRKALGRVMKEAWERQDFEEVDILLG
jgi:hypothetical protein